MPNERLGTIVLVVVGCGGNIGSHLVPHLARMAAVDRVVLIDRDTYEQKNLTSQDITPDDLGKPKAIVQAKRLEAIRPSLVVQAVCADVTALPLAALRGDVILGCLDNNSSRQFLSEAAWHLGVPLLDAGVRHDGLLARVNLYIPGPHAPCMQCTWDSRHYLSLENNYPCEADTTAPATRSPSFLGSLAASLQAVECAKLLEGNLDRAAVGKQVLIDANSHKHYLSKIPVNEHCRFDHQVWEIEPLDQDPGQITLGQALALGGDDPSEHARLSFSFRPKVFFRKRFSCPSCLSSTVRIGLRDALPAHLLCERCGERTDEEIVGITPELDSSTLAPSLLALSMVSIGFRAGDVFTVMSPEQARRFEISGHSA